MTFIITQPVHVSDTAITCLILLSNVAKQPLRLNKRDEHKLTPAKNYTLYQSLVDLQMIDEPEVFIKSFSKDDTSEAARYIWQQVVPNPSKKTYFGLRYHSSKPNTLIYFSFTSHTRTNMIYPKCYNIDVTVKMPYNGAYAIAETAICTEFNQCSNPIICNPYRYGHLSFFSYETSVSNPIKKDVSITYPDGVCAVYTVFPTLGTTFEAVVQDIKAIIRAYYYEDKLTATEKEDALIKLAISDKRDGVSFTNTLANLCSAEVLPKKIKGDANITV